MHNYDYVELVYRILEYRKDIIVDILVHYTFQKALCTKLGNQSNIQLQVAKRD